jgi:AH receptor-interacting protein
MEIILGKKFKLEAWELCLQAMAVNEVARFRVKRQLTYNYPTVAKTLRDAYNKKDKNKPVEPPQHMCGMMAMQMHGGLGYDDLNELMKVKAHRTQKKP